MAARPLMVAWHASRMSCAATVQLDCGFSRLLSWDVFPMTDQSDAEMTLVTLHGGGQPGTPGQ